MLLFLFIGSVVLIGAGTFALVYAGHQAAPEAADPQSPHRWFHYGAIVLTVLGILLLIAGVIAAANFTR